MAAEAEAAREARAKVGTIQYPGLYNREAKAKVGTI